MGSVVQLKQSINNSYTELLKSVEDKLTLVDEKYLQNYQVELNLYKKWQAIILIQAEKITSSSYIV